MDRSVRAPGSGTDLSEWKELIAVGLFGGAAEAAGLSLRLGEHLYGGPHQDGVTWQPLDLAIRLGTHHVVWDGSATAGAVTLGVGAVMAAGGSVWACRRCRHLATTLRNRHTRKGQPRYGGLPRRAEKLPIDTQAHYLARDKETADLTHKAQRAKAERLGVRLTGDDTPGISIGESVLNPRMLYASYEDLHLDVMGPRAGKSSSRVIPAVMEAIGAVVATSNKRDVVDSTRGHRAGLGEVRVFDPQGVAQTPCTWFWDPIDWVRGTDGGADAQVRAAQLAGHFADGGEASKKDAFFDPEGEELLVGLILAAAVSKKPITQVFMWVTDPHEEEPVDVLHNGGYEMVAAGLRDQYNAPDRQRAGIFSTAKKMAACLKYDRIKPWVTPPKPGEAAREPFDVQAFATSRDTLYPLSLEGPGNAGPLVAALTEAVVTAASAEGVRCGGRLPVPMLVALDEAANIVKWRDLPKKYSHFGSRGIVVMTILQSWAQGVHCWGDDGMKALWSAANVRVLGPGLADAGFLRDISDLVGDHFERTSSVTKSKAKGGGSESTSWSLKTEKTLTPSDLAAIPPGRALVMASGHRPTLVRLIPWWDRPYAAQVTASQKQHDPAQSAI